MFKIALFSENKKFISFVKEIIDKILREERIVYELTSFELVNESLFTYMMDLHEKYDLYMIDLDKEVQVDFDELSIKLNSTIIMTSSHDCQTAPKYIMKNRYYSLKPLTYSILHRVLIYDYVKNIAPKYILIENGANVSKIYEKDIVYVFVEQRGIQIVMENEQLSSAEKIGAFHKRLNEDVFLKCHKSFLINIHRITSVSRYEAVLDTKMSIPISKSCYNVVKQRFLQVEKGQELISNIFYEKN